MDSTSITVENKCIVSQKWDGSKDPRFEKWSNKVLSPALAKQSFTDGWTGFQVALRQDQGGANGPAYAGGGGNAAAQAAQIADQTLKHNNRVTRLAGLVIESVKESSNIRATLSDPILPFLTDGVLGRNYLIQECTQVASIEDAAKTKRRWENLKMEEYIPVDKFTHNSVHEWIEHAQTEYDLIPIAIRPTENELCLLLIRGLTTKMGSARTRLLSSTDCPANLKYNAALAAQAFNAGPPIVIPQIARAVGEFRKPLLLDYLKEQWKLGIDGKTIHIKSNVNYFTDINAFTRGKGKGRGRGRGGFRGRSLQNNSPPSKPRAGNTIVCFKCGGIAHTASDCSSKDEDKPTIKTLVAIQYPSHIVFRWPSSFTAEAMKNPNAKVSNHIDSSAVESDNDDDDDYEGEEGAGEEDEEGLPDDEESNEEKVMRFCDESVQRDILPRRGYLHWFSR